MRATNPKSLTRSSINAQLAQQLTAALTAAGWTQVGPYLAAQLQTPPPGHLRATGLFRTAIEPLNPDQRLFPTFELWTQLLPLASAGADQSFTGKTA